MADLAERYHTLWRRLECIALRAVALHLLGQRPGVEHSFPAHRAHHAANEQPALALVAELVQIAVSLGFRRLFLDQGDLLPAMVRQLVNIYRKPGADNRHDAVARALQLGLV
jgi:nucleoside-diphosphate-sugar epimerase